MSSLGHGVAAPGPGAGSASPGSLSTWLSNMQIQRFCFYEIPRKDREPLLVAATRILISKAVS